MPSAHAHAHRGFTLIELLVVVTIIMILLALLTPALEKAIYEAEKVVCLTNQRNIVQGTHAYAQSHKRYLPPWRMPGRGWSSAYDIRTLVEDNNVNVNPVIRYPLGIGMLPEFGYVPTAGKQLGKLFHCPFMDNRGNPNSVGGAGQGTRFAGVGMNVVHDWGVGAGYWDSTDPAHTIARMVVGYNYRSPSWENQRKGAMTLSNIASKDLILVDLPDQRHTGYANGPGTIPGDEPWKYRAFTHPEGYLRVFGDGHGSMHYDPDYKTAAEIYGAGWGTMDGYAGKPQNSNNGLDPIGGGGKDERVYREFMNVDRR